MAYANAYGQYKQVQISTASPGKLILMLYQGAIKAMKKAAELIDKKDFGGKGDCLIKAQDIIMELNLALDMNAGEVAASLRQLYFYIYRRLIDANLELNTVAIQECIQLMEGLHESWEVAVQKAEGGTQGDVTSARLSFTG